MLIMKEICICVRASKCERVVVCFNYILSKKSICVMSGLCPEDENSTCQTR